MNGEEQSMKLVEIAAVGRNLELGYQGDMPWKRALKKDLKAFRQITKGHPVLMGRRTFESLGKPLPGRTNIVLSSSMAPVQGVLVYPDYDSFAAEWAKRNETVYVIGGGTLYRALIEQADALVLTRIAAEYPADVWFPSFDEKDFEGCMDQEESEEDGTKWQRWIYTRKQS